MRIAVISDIHGNLIALEAVLADIATKGTDQIVCLGDIASMGPQPRETIEKLRSLENCLVIQGNTDAWCDVKMFDNYVPRTERERRMMEIFRWGMERLSQEEVEYLLRLRPRHEITLGGRDSILFVHGSPRKNNEAMLPTTPEDALKEMLDGVEARIIACGHAHWPMIRPCGEKIVFNVGSVGWPMDGDPRAAYGLITWSRGNLSTELCRVGYDVEKVAAKAISRDMPWANSYAASIRMAHRLP
jgi:putative phosphoesterase